MKTIFPQAHPSRPSSGAPAVGHGTPDFLLQLEEDRSYESKTARTCGVIVALLMIYLVVMVTMWIQDAKHNWQPWFEDRASAVGIR